MGHTSSEETKFGNVHLHLPSYLPVGPFSIRGGTNQQNLNRLKTSHTVRRQALALCLVWCRQPGRFWIPKESLVLCGCCHSAGSEEAGSQVVCDVSAHAMPGLLVSAWEGWVCLYLF